MEEEKINEIQQPAAPAAPAPQEQKKVGRILGFHACTDDYLEAVRRDLDLDCTLDDLRLLRAYSNERGGDLTVSEVRFFTAVRRTAASAPDRVRAAALAADTDPAAAELFARLSGAFARRRPRLADPPALTELAAFAALQRGSSAGLTVSLCRRDAPLAPTFTGSRQELFSDGEYLLSVSHGLPRRGLCRPYAAILRPLSGQIAEDFFAAADVITRRRYDTHPEDLILPLSRRGLLTDLSELDTATRADAAALGGRPPHFEDLTADFAPGYLIFTERSAVPSLIADAGECGAAVCFPVTAAEGGSLFAAIGKEAVRVEPALLRRLRRLPDVPLSVGELTLTGSEEDVPAEALTPDARFRVVSRAVGARDAAGLRAALDRAADDAQGAPLALAGTLCPTDGSALPLLLALDAFVRTRGAEIAGAHFDLADATSLRVFFVR